jgi:hypothetical protein
MASSVVKLLSGFLISAVIGNASATSCPNCETAIDQAVSTASLLQAKSSALPSSSMGPAPTPSDTRLANYSEDLFPQSAAKAAILSAVPCNVWLLLLDVNLNIIKLREVEVTEKPMQRSYDAAIGKAQHLKNDGFSMENVCIETSCWQSRAIPFNFGLSNGFPALGAKMLKYSRDGDVVGFYTVGGCLDTPENDEMVTCAGLVAAGYANENSSHSGACPDTWILP